jgi:hypothetical protein
VLRGDNLSHDLLIVGYRQVVQEPWLTCDWILRRPNRDPIFAFLRIFREISEGTPNCMRPQEINKSCPDIHIATKYGSSLSLFGNRNGDFAHINLGATCPSV